MLKTKLRSALFGKSSWRRGLELGVLLALFFLLAGVVEATRVAPTDHPAVLANINLGDTIKESDVIWLQNDLIWLHDYMPEWYTYVMQAEPFTLSIDLGAGEHGIAANVQCCDVHGNGIISFGERLGDLAISTDAEDQMFEARRIEFLSTLIHEVTHLRDRKSGYLSESIDFTTCVNGERSAYSRELDFKRAVASLQIDSAPSSAELYWQSVKRHLADEENAFNAHRWILFCMALQPGDCVWVVPLIENFP